MSFFPVPQSSHSQHTKKGETESRHSAIATSVLRKASTLVRRATARRVNASAVDFGTLWVRCRSWLAIWARRANHDSFRCDLRRGGTGRFWGRRRLRSTPKDAAASLFSLSRSLSPSSSTPCSPYFAFIFFYYTTSFFRFCLKRGSGG